MTQHNVRGHALELLLKINQEGAFSPLALNSAIEHNPFSDDDAKLLTRLVYGSLQHRNTLLFYIKSFIGKKKIEPWVRELLILSFYQKAYLDRIPDHAIVGEAVKIAKRRGHRGISGFVNGVLRNLMRKGLPNLSTIKNEKERAALYYSHPSWLMQAWEHQFGPDVTRAICEANNRIANVTIRNNRLKQTRDTLSEQLASSGIQTRPGEMASDSLIVEKGMAVKTTAFKEGAFTVQDESSMLVAQALAPEEGATVLDMCAAPGGKTTHLGEWMNNTGTIHALDIHEHKVRLIEQQAERLGINSIKTNAADARTVQETFKPEMFDYILLDAPCTGFGVIKRKPEIKWSKQPKDVTAIAHLQYELITAAAPLLRPGGRLVYSTCTIGKKENEDVINRFLETHREYETDKHLATRMGSPFDPIVSQSPGMMQILPQHFNADGFFIGALVKKPDGTR